MIAQEDDPAMMEWLRRASLEGGGFISSVAFAGLRASHENYPILRPALLAIRKRYPAYEPTAAELEEIGAGRPAV